MDTSSTAEVTATTASTAPEGVAEPLTEREPGCLGIIEALPAPEPASVEGDPLQALLEGEIPPLPLADHEDPGVLEQVVVESVDEFFVAYPNIIAPIERRETMEDAGFIGSVDIGFVYGQDHYSVQVTRFGSPEGAQAYYEVHLRRICRDALNLRPLETPVGGVVYTRETGPLLLPRAIALVGDTQIAVTICHCVGVSDLESLAAEWLSLLASHVRGS